MIAFDLKVHPKVFASTNLFPSIKLQNSYSIYLEPIQIIQKTINIL